MKMKIARNVKRLFHIALVVVLLLCSIVDGKAQTSLFPSTIQNIKSHAFYGDLSLDVVQIPSGTVSIGTCAFAYSSVTDVKIPSSVEYIAPDAFAETKDLSVFRCKRNSYADNWAKSNNLSGIIRYDDETAPQIVEYRTTDSYEGDDKWFWLNFTASDAPYYECWVSTSENGNYEFDGYSTGRLENNNPYSTGFVYIFSGYPGTDYWLKIKARYDDGSTGEFGNPFHIFYREANSTPVQYHIITQYQSKYKDVKFTGGYNLYNAGCGYFTAAHALEWLLNIEITKDNELALMKELTTKLKVNSVDSGWTAVATALAKNYPVIYHKGEMNDIANKKSKVLQVFDDGGVIAANPVGHFVLAVGYKYYNDKLYICIVDSSQYSTIEPRGDLKLHVGYEYSTMKEIETQVQGGGRYWIPWECFCGKCGHQRYFRDWWWMSAK